MHATVHPIDGVPGPHDDSWVDAVLTALRARAVPAGALVARPLDLGPGRVVALWDDAADAAAFAPGAAGPVTIGPGLGYEVRQHWAGTSPGPARYLQLASFGEHGEAWGTAFDRAGADRIWPAVGHLPGLVTALTGAGPAGSRVSLTLADSVEALEAATAGLMSTALLPWEDPADLVGPEALAVLRLVHADLPVAVTR